MSTPPSFLDWLRSGGLPPRRKILDPDAVGATQRNALALEPLVVTPDPMATADALRRLEERRAAATFTGQRSPFDEGTLTDQVDDMARNQQRAAPRTLPAVLAAPPLRARETTRLAPEDETKFAAWVRQNGVADVDDPRSHYDYRGYWRDIASQGGDQTKAYEDGLHFPDTYKQHGHPTFSVESRYSAGPEDGGEWNGEQFVSPAERVMLRAQGARALTSTAPMLGRSTLAQQVDDMVTRQEHTPPPQTVVRPPSVSGDATRWVKEQEVPQSSTVGPFEGTEEEYQRGAARFEEALARRSDFMRQSRPMQYFERAAGGVTSGALFGRENQLMAALDPSRTTADYDAQAAALPKPTGGEQAATALGTLAGAGAGAFQGLERVAADEVGGRVASGLFKAARRIPLAHDADLAARAGMGARMARGAVGMGAYRLASRGGAADPDLLHGLVQDAVMGGAFGALPHGTAPRDRSPAARALEESAARRAPPQTRRAIRLDQSMDEALGATQPRDSTTPVRDTNVFGVEPGTTILPRREGPAYGVRSPVAQSEPVGQAIASSSRSVRAPEAVEPPRERVVAAGFLAEGGGVMAGGSHAGALSRTGGTVKPKEFGFVTSDGRFVSYDEAAALEGQPYIHNSHEIPHLQDLDTSRLHEIDAVANSRLRGADTEGALRHFLPASEQAPARSLVDRLVSPVRNETGATGDIRETIAPSDKAAIRTEDGRVFRGTNHGDAWLKAREAGAPTGTAEDGFITTTGRFVDREEGYRIAERAGQVRRTPEVRQQAVGMGQTDRLHARELVDPDVPPAPQIPRSFREDAAGRRAYAGGARDSNPRRQGYEAASEYGLAREANEFPDDSPEWLEWDQGWRSAQRRTAPPPNEQRGYDGPVRSVEYEEPGGYRIAGDESGVAATRSQRRAPWEMTYDELLDFVPPTALTDGSKSVRHSAAMREGSSTLADYTDPQTVREWLGGDTTLAQRALRGESIPIFRATGAEAETGIFPGAYVTPSREYALQHARSNLLPGGSGARILEGTARPEDLIAINPNEFVLAPRDLRQWHAELVAGAEREGVPTARRPATAPRELKAIRLRDGAIVSGENHGIAVNHAEDAGLLPKDLDPAAWPNHFETGHVAPDGTFVRSPSRAAGGEVGGYVAEPIAGGKFRVWNPETGDVAEPSIGGFDAQKRAQAIARRLSEPLRNQTGAAGDVRTVRVYTPQGGIVAGLEHPDVTRAEAALTALQDELSTKYAGVAPHRFEATADPADLARLDELQGVYDSALEANRTQILDDFLQRQRGSAVPGRAGAANPALAMMRATGGAGAAGLYGYATGDPDDEAGRAARALGFAAAGAGLALAPEALRSMRRVAGDEIGAIMPDPERLMHDALNRRGAQVARGDLGRLALGEMDPADFSRTYGVSPSIARRYADHARTLSDEPGYRSPLDSEEAAYDRPAREPFAYQEPPEPRPIDAVPDDSFLPPDTPPRRYGAGQGQAGMSVFSPEGVTTLRRSAMLMNAAGRIRDIVSNAGLGATETSAELIGTGVDALLDLVPSLRGGRTMAFNAPAVARAAYEGLTAGTADMARAIRGKPRLHRSHLAAEEAATASVEGAERVVMSNPILDAAVRVTGRFAGSVDSQAAVFAYEKSIARQARVIALNERIGRRVSRTQAAAMEADLRANPTDEMKVLAASAVAHATFTNESVASRILKGVREATFPNAKTGSPDLPWARAGLDFIAPFRRVPGAVAGKTLEYSPLGAVKMTRDAVRLYKLASAGADPALIAEARRGFAMTTGRVGTGAGVIVMGAHLADRGLMTGAHLTPEQKNDGARPFSIKIAGRWWPLGMMPPVGPMLAVGAELHNHGVAEGAAALGENVADATLMRGMGDVREAVSDPDKAERFASSAASSFIPPVVGQVARIIDPVARKPENPWQAIEARIPGLSRNVPARTAAFGQEQRETASPLGRVALALFDGVHSTPSRRGKDPAQDSLTRMRVNVGTVRRKAAETEQEFAERIADYPEAPHREDETEAQYQRRAATWNRPRPAETDAEFRQRQRDLYASIHANVAALFARTAPQDEYLNEKWSDYHSAEATVREEHPNLRGPAFQRAVQEERRRVVTSLIAGTKRSFAEAGDEDPRTYLTP